LRLRFCGVRGSTPAPGQEFVRVGGHTSCVAVSADGEPTPSLVLDAGTGLQRVSALMEGGPFQGSILLTHLHWDHTHGLPFFSAGDRPDSRVRLLLPDQGEDPWAVMARAMSPPHFPIGPEGLEGDWRLSGLEPGEHVVEQFLVTAFDVPHKGGRTFGYRVADGECSVAYLPDHLPARTPDPALVELLRGVDVLIHDAQFTAAEQGSARRFGHATVDQAVELARTAGAGRLVLFHHAPGRIDDDVERMAAAAASPGLEVGLAREGDGLRLSGTGVTVC
jgi:ribonuclease BN (tRNA processing enzyme)